MTTLTTKRPASTVVSIGITLFGGAGTLHATLADNSDATYASIANGAGAVDFATLTVATSSIIRSVLRLRCRRSTTDTVLYAHVNDGPYLAFYPPTTGSSWATLASTSQTTLTAAQLAAGARLTFNTSGFADIAAAYLDVTEIPVPTVDVTAPTGTIGVSRPTVTWTYAGDYPQERFRVKVFSTSQYGAAGFNPDTSSPVFDSGEHLSGSTLFLLTSNLPSGVTYRVYVRAAQRVGSTLQWSAWDFTQPTVTVTPPPVPVLTVTPDSTFGRIQIVATDTGSPTWQFVNIERTTDGTTWTPVRSANRAPVLGTTFTVYDYESGNGEPVQYRAQSVLADPGGDIASEWSAPTGQVTWASTDAWLKSLTQPTLNRNIIIQDIPTVTRRIPRSVVDVAGRRDPIVISDTRKWLEGTVTFVTLEDADRLGLQALLDTSETLLLQTPMSWGFGSRYVSCGDEDENRTSPSALETSRLITVPFNEVSAPVGQVITFGSTYDDIAAAFATYDAVEAAFPTYTAVLAGPP